MIDIKYTLRNTQINDKQKELLTKKLERKLAKFGKNANVILTINQKHKNYIINIVTIFKKHHIKVKGNEYSFEKSLDLALNKLKTQINKVESKVITH